MNKWERPLSTYQSLAVGKFSILFFLKYKRGNEPTLRVLIDVVLGSNYTTLAVGCLLFEFDVILRRQFLLVNI